MTALSVMETLEKIKVDGFRIDVIDVLPLTQGNMSVHTRVQMHIKDRKTGEPSALVGMMHIHGSTTHNEVCRKVHEYMQSMLLHELDELFLVDGERVFDPHA